MEPVTQEPIEFVWLEPAGSRLEMLAPLAKNPWALLRFLALGWIIILGPVVVVFLIRSLWSPLPVADLIRALALGLLASPLVLGLLILDYRFFPGLPVRVSHEGVRGLLKGPTCIGPDRIISIGVEPLHNGRSALRVVYRGPRERQETRSVWLQPQVDPVALEQFLREQGWPKSPPTAQNGKGEVRWK